MATMYVRNAEGNFVRAGAGGVTTDTTLSMAGKPADAQAVGDALANCAPMSLVSEYVYYQKSETDDVIMDIYSRMLDDQQTRRVCANENGEVWFWDIFRSSEDYGCLMAYKYGAYGIALIRSKNIYNGNISLWAYQNPDVNVGIEYRTMEHWQGRPVYTKLIDLGGLPNNTKKSVSYVDTAVKSAIRCVGMTVNGDTLPLYSNDGIINIYASNKNVHVISNYDASDVGGYAQIWYVKYHDVM